MKNCLTVNYENKPAYNIVFEPDYNKLPELLCTLEAKSRKIMIVTECNVGKYYLDEVKAVLSSVTDAVYDFVFPAGEASKNLDTVSLCYEKLIKEGFDRNDFLLALGGGVVGDLTGFIAATYLRGIRFIQLPTSLLSMVDSSIGGKTGVDFKAYKNMVGAFYQPKLVYMNLTTLNTLQEREYLSGMGEIIKHGLIKDASYYFWLKDNSEKILQKDYEVIKEMIYQSCLIKKEVVERDPKEKGERALLNFGHTIGHSLEKLMNFSMLHGECVSVGIAAASYLSMKRGFIKISEWEDILSTLELFRLPVFVLNLNKEEVYEVTKLDKKMDSAKIRFILLNTIGNAVIDPTVSKEEMSNAIHSVVREM